MAWFDFLNAANARGRDAGSIARQRLSARAGIPAARVPAPRGGGLNLGLVNPVTAAYSIPGFAEQRERNMDYVRETSRGPLNELNYIGGQLLQGRLPYAPTSIQNRPVVNPQFLRPDYSGAGERARRFQEYRLGTDIPGANTDYSSRLGSATSTSNPAAERAYRQEVSSVAQQAAQNPELQRYEAARGVAKTQEEMNAVRDEGMRIWAARHGGLAAKVKPGSTGYEAIQGVIGPSAPSALSSEQVQGLMSFDPNTVLSTTQKVQKQFRPNQELKDQEILDAMSFDPNTAMRSAAGMAFAPMSSTLSSEQVQGLMSFDPNTVLSTTQKVQKQFRPNQELKDQEILNAMSFDPNTAMRSAAGMAFAPGLPSVTGQEASRKLFEELLKRAAQNK